MDHQQAIAVLKNMLEKRRLDDEEKEALLTAMGMLSWAALGKSRIKAQKAKRDKSTEWGEPTKPD